MKRIFTIIAIAVLGLCNLGQARAQATVSAFLGSWTQDMAKSTYDPPNLAPKSGSFKREASGEGYKQTTDGVNAQGARTQTAYTAATLDGKDYPLMGSGEFDTVEVKLLDANTMINVDKKAGVVVRMIRSTLSKDGKTMTSELVGYNSQGVAYHQVAVYEKQ